MSENIRWENFCLEYVKTGNATQSYMTVYNSKSVKTAQASAFRLLRKEWIKNRIAALQQEIHDEKIADATEIQLMLTKIARQEQYEEVVVTESIEKGISQAKIMMKKPSVSDAVRALALLSRLQGLDRGSNQVNILIPVLNGEENLED